MELMWKERQTTATGLGKTGEITAENRKESENTA